MSSPHPWHQLERQSAQCPGSCPCWPDPTMYVLLGQCTLGRLGHVYCMKTVRCVVSQNSQIVTQLWITSPEVSCYRQGYCKSWKQGSLKSFRDTLRSLKKHQNPQLGTSAPYSEGLNKQTDHFFPYFCFKNQTYSDLYCNNVTFYISPCTVSDS